MRWHMFVKDQIKNAFGVTDYTKAFITRLKAFTELVSLVHIA